ncbi:neutral zinc metallopeptidase [Sphingobium sufflavum]|uniref:KPN_02809 family neutral zinc metallopeptidase n=1 Tax=Sphingobium sufflavum TaxID=1129547 RepID=UPI001F2B0ED8|nr:neutral zinc metallopeptidase [Sphingobium sufflavum]MCE7797167.1 neutral zinc metallopeptidase [Sphingobium sufflavum]
MRLDDEQESSNFEVQQGGGGGGFGGGGGGMLGLLLPLIGSRFGCGGIAVVLLILAVTGGLGNLGSMLGGGGTGGSPAVEGSRDPAQLTPVQHWSLKVLGSTERTWGRLFQQSGEKYEPTILVFYNQSGMSGCGAAQSAMGPFYCPTDKKVYLDTSFFDELTQRFGAPGDFAQAYVIAHEVGHHIQDITGVLAKANSEQRRLGSAEANAVQVKVELQADCYAGVWGRETGLMEAGDIEEGLKAAQAIGDDTLQKGAGRTPMPDSFTHGSSEQRMRWLKKGLESGDPSACDTFSSAI